LVARIERHAALARRSAQSFNVIGDAFKKKVGTPFEPGDGRLAAIFSGLGGLPKGIIAVRLILRPSTRPQRERDTALSYPSAG